MEAAATATPGPLDRYHAACSKLLSNPRFRRWAAAFPLTRPIARLRARKIFDLCAGFVYSQVLYACVRLRLFEILAEGAQPADRLARKMGLPAEAAERLLAAAVSLRLIVQASNGRYRLGPLGAPLVGNVAITSMIEHHALLYADLRDPLTLLRDGPQPTALAGYWPYAGTIEPSAMPGGGSCAYSRLMSDSQPLVAEEILAAYPFARHRCLLDVGGGEGGFLARAAQSAPLLKLMLFDLPEVAARARERFSALGLADRIEVFGGSFLTDRLPKGADVVSLVRVIHDHDDDAARKILRAVRRAMAAHSVVLIAEPMSGTPGAEPVGDAYFGFYLLAMGRGRPRTPERLSELLVEAGFACPKLIPTNLPIQTRLLQAVVPR
ncbi:MAG: methyltransferase [Nevskia sp.]